MIRLSQYMGDFQPEAHVNGFSGFNFIAFICSSCFAVSEAMFLSKIMTQKYKVFVNERPLIITRERPLNTNGNVFSLGDDDVRYAVHSLYKGNLESAFIIDHSETIMDKFQSKLPMIVAAGGLVRNTEGKTLFIFRDGKWDLPKGKLDKKESIEKAALREVEEETGVKKLVIEKYLQTTYHIFKRQGVFKLKKVYWFMMTTTYEGKLKAQKEEGITKAKWLSPEKVEKALENSYHNIRLLFGNY